MNPWLPGDGDVGVGGVGRDLHETFLLIQLFQQLYTISEKKNGLRKLPSVPHNL